LLLYYYYYYNILDGFGKVSRLEPEATKISEY